MQPEAPASTASLAVATDVIQRRRIRGKTSMAVRRAHNASSSSSVAPRIHVLPGDVSLRPLEESDDHIAGLFRHHDDMG